MDSSDRNAWHERGLIQQIDLNQISIVIPDACRLPPELDRPVPRTVPDWIRKSPPIRRMWLLSWFAVVQFAIAIALGATPLGGPGAKIAFWITAIFGGLGVLGLFTSRKELRYVKSGVASAGRVLSMTLQPAQIHNGQTTGYEHVVELELLINTGDRLERTVRGLPVAESDREHVRARFSVGDVVPVVWLPGRFASTLNLYDFLSFNASHTLIRREDSFNRGTQKFRTALAVVAILAILIGNLFLFLRCVPVGMNPIAVGGIAVCGALVLGGGSVWAVLRQMRMERWKVEVRNFTALRTGRAIETGVAHAIMSNSLIGWVYFLTMIVGFAVFGGFTLVLWAFGVNIWLDHAPAKNVIVTVTAVQPEKDSRGVRIEFRRPDQPGQYSKAFAGRDVPPIPLALGTEFQVDWHPGRLGWPWIDNFQPARLKMPLAAGN